MYIVWGCCLWKWWAWTGTTKRISHVGYMTSLSKTRTLNLKKLMREVAKKMTIVALEGPVEHLRVPIRRRIVHTQLIPHPQ